MNLVSSNPTFSARPASRASRRAATRRDVVLPCQVVRERDFRLVADRTLDVSPDGMLLPLSGAFAKNVMTGDAVIVSFSIPGLWIDVEATVTRVVHGRRPEDEGPACGIVFDTIGSAARSALAGFLHGRPPPLPRRGPLARLRRGLDGPRLADQLAMETFVPMPFARVVELEPEADVEDAVEAVTDDDGLDGLGVLREVAQAWKRLAMLG